MFPYIEIFWMNLYFQWLWIVIATLVFFYWLYRYSYKFNLRFSYLFSFFSFFIIVPYFFWRYFYDFIEYHNFLPLDILHILSPYNYNFSFIGVSFWLMFMVFLFLMSLSYKQERKKYIDVFFYSITLAMIVIWPFLLLWDSFYGLPTESVFWIQAFSENTQIPFTGSIRPIWIFISILWVLLYLLWKIIYFIVKKPWITIYLIPFLFLGFSYIFTFQHYPKHFLFTIDIKILYCYIMAVIYPVFLYLLTIKNKIW